MDIRHGCIAALAALGLAGAASAAPPAATEGELTRPDIERWVFLGATTDHGVVPEDGMRKFSAEDPGMILVTRMEPGAYDHFMKHGRYADGTTFATSIYKPHEDPVPAMDGVVQGDLAVLFVHRLERGDDGLGHAFYVFPNGAATANRAPQGNDCMACHASNGALDGTYVQFYPVLRERLQAGPPAAATDADADQEVVQAVRTMFDALMEDDMPRYRSVMAPGFYAFEAGRRMDSDELVEVVNTKREAGLAFEWNVTDPEVRIDGLTAWVTWVNRGAIRRGAEKMDMVWLESAVLRNDSGAWRLRFLHSTPAPPGK